MDATEQSVDRLRHWLAEFQGRTDSQHKEVMNELHLMKEAQDKQSGAREQNARVWKAAGILATVIVAVSTVAAAMDYFKGA